MISGLLSSQNRLFELARPTHPRAPRFVAGKLYAVLATLYAFLVPILGSLLVAIPIVIFFIAQGRPPGPNPLALGFGGSIGLTISLLVAFIPIYLLIWLWLVIFERRQLWTIGMEQRSALMNYLRGCAVGLVMFSASVGLFAVPGYVEFETGGAQLSGSAALGGIVIALIGWIVQGAAEEALARGFILPIVGVRFSPLAGVAISALIFMAIHAFNPNLSSIALLNLFLFGVFTALYALYEGGLWGVFAIHSVWNWAQGNLFGFEVSGQGLRSATLIDLQETGPNWLTGGAFGPEGGLAVTGVLLISSALVWLAQHSRQTRA